MHYHAQKCVSTGKTFCEISIKGRNSNPETLSMLGMSTSLLLVPKMVLQGVSNDSSPEHYSFASLLTTIPQKSSVVFYNPFQVHVTLICTHLWIWPLKSLILDTFFAQERLLHLCFFYKDCFSLAFTTFLMVLRVLQLVSWDTSATLASLKVVLLLILLFFPFLYCRKKIFLPMQAFLVKLMFELDFWLSSKNFLKYLVISRAVIPSPSSLAMFCFFWSSIDDLLSIF